MVLRVLLWGIAQRLQAHSHGATSGENSHLHNAAIAFIHRFASSLNGHMHFHVCDRRDV